MLGILSINDLLNMVEEECVNGCLRKDQRSILLKGNIEERFIDYEKGVFDDEFRDTVRNFTVRENICDANWKQTKRAHRKNMKRVWKDPN